MVKLTEVSEHERKHLLAKISEYAVFTGNPWALGPVLSKRRIAIVTTSGIHRRGDITFGEGVNAVDYRVIPKSTKHDELVMSHLSVNFDRSGFHQDVNIVFPIDRLMELAADGTIGSVAEYHYSFMGAAPPKSLEPRARQLAVLLKQDNVDSVLLTPV